MEENNKIRVLKAALHIIICFSIIFFGVHSVHCQQIIGNESFENFHDCPKTITEFKDKFSLPNWYSPTKGTPDYFNKCNRLDVSVPVNFMGHNWAKSGDAYIGLVLAEHPDDKKTRVTRNYREYVQTEFNESLIKDSLYKVSFYCCLAPNSKFAVNHLGVAITVDPIKGRYKVLPTNNIVAGIDTHNIDTVRGRWVLVEGQYRAQGGERYLTLGNFKDDDQIKFVELNTSSYRRSLQIKIHETGFAYYYFDVVEVVPVTVNFPGN